jgi:transcriptional regulator with XRE-family HTH domain
MSNILTANVKRICKQQGIQLKDLADKMNVDASSLTRILKGNPTLDSIEKIATALKVTVKTLVETKNEIEGYVKINGNIYHFNSKEELENVLKYN